MPIPSNKSAASPLTTPAKRALSSTSPARLLTAYGTPASSQRPMRRSRKRLNTNDERITVCVRKRPLKEASRDIVAVDASSGVCSIECTRTGLDGLRRETVDMAFRFDRVFPDTSTNAQVYAETLKPLVNAFVEEGAKCTCFAYGQTGSGKTHTILGNDDSPGLLFLAVQDLMLRTEQELHFAFYEIYQGQLYDLLSHRRRVAACEQDGLVKILGLRTVPVCSVEHVRELVREAMSLRRSGSTSANDDSSRSHAVIQFSLSPQSTSTGKLVIVDLAGSERAMDRAVTTSPRSKLEASEINKSLLALKECIRAMDACAQSTSDTAYVPFRSSKLTQVLKDAFVATSVNVPVRTCMIATINPSASNFEVSLNTLRYADRVKELSATEDDSENGLIEQDFVATPSKAPRLATAASVTPAEHSASTDLTTARHTNNGPSQTATPTRNGNLKRRIELCMHSIMQAVDRESRTDGDSEVLPLVLEELTILNASLSKLA